LLYRWPNRADADQTAIIAKINSAEMLEIATPTAHAAAKLAMSKLIHPFHSGNVSGKSR
jgi:hypothetical protein